jgi:hypothetical protein
MTTWLCYRSHRAALVIRFAGPVRLLWCDTCRAFR